jgi:hypothetical protein
MRERERESESEREIATTICVLVPILAFVHHQEIMHFKKKPRESETSATIFLDAIPWSYVQFGIMTVFFLLWMY